MLHVENLSFQYPGSRRRRPALSDVSFNAEPGQVVFVLGPNGSGKSTLFRLLLRLMRPATGTITADGQELASLSQQELARTLSYIPQQEELAFNYRARDVILMGRTPHLSRFGQRPGPDDLAAVDAALATLHIEELAERGMRTLSGGERQLVLIARALCQKSRVLILDEPTSALDFGNQSMLLRQIRHLADLGYLVIVSSHNPMQALQYADRLLLLRAGQILMSGDPDEVTETHLSEIYGTPLRIITAEQAPGLRFCVPVDPARSKSEPTPFRAHRGQETTKKGKEKCYAAE